MGAFRSAVLGLCGLCTLGGSVAEAGRLSVVEAGGWQVEAIASDETGKFSGCIAMKTYGSAFLAFDIHQSFGWVLVFESPALKVRKGQKFELLMQVDKGPTFKGEAIVGAKGLVQLLMGQKPPVLESLKAGQQLHLHFKDTVVSYPLSGMEPMLKALQDCMRRGPQPESVPTPAPGATPAAPKVEAAAPSRATPKPQKRGKVHVYTGSGFFVSRDGALLTNAHVVEGCSEAAITGFGKATIVATTRKDDLALLRLATPARTEAARFRREPSQLGESVYVLGFPLAGQLDNGLNFTSGVISSLAGPGNDAGLVQLTAPVQPGNSGGPMVDASGLVTGVMQSKLGDMAALKSTGAVPQNVNFGIKAPLATSFLRANGVEPQEASGQRPLTPVVIAKEVGAYTVQVTCVAR